MAAEKAQRKAAIEGLLREIDAKKVRPTSAVALAQALGQAPDQADVQKLAELEGLAEPLRVEWKGL